MSEKLAEVYEQYDMEILAAKKGRGATILTTTEGLRILEPFRGNLTRLEQEYVLKQLFEEAGCLNLDYLIPNREGSLFTCDKYRQPFVLKKHFEGNECDMHNPSDIVRAIKALAEFHLYGKEIVVRFQRAWKENLQRKERKRIEEIKRAIVNGEELDKISYVYEISQNALEEVLGIAESDGSGTEKAEEKINPDEAFPQEDGFDNSACFDIENLFIRHNKELKKIQRFIMRVKQKNSFENLFLQVFSSYYRQGTECMEMLAQVIKGEERVSAQSVFQNHYGICHGSYNQHNVILGKDTEAIVHFERFSKGNQLNDLYQFARKAMEKNHFDFTLLEDIFRVYAERISLTGEDYHYMYILFSYPEKFWKIANSYYNTNKAFLSPKYVEKLETVILQETEKGKLLEEYREHYVVDR
ncbi:MAG: hypothetical protein NC300_09365 [Bacteroidales bacterium]|nr:hypothetical protein [Clostridium sp.]MCM1204339.1 hypothetical protein [Bacteroidales bacterium]